MNPVMIPLTDLPARLAEAVELARGGTEVVVTDAAGPVAKLVPAAPPRREWAFNLHPGALVMRDDFTDPVDEEDFLRGDV